MENKYWIGRKRSAMAMAREAVTSQARLIHYDLAGRYSIMAAQSLRSTGGEPALLHLRQPEPSPAAPLHLRADGEGS